MCISSLTHRINCMIQLLHACKMASHMSRGHVFINAVWDTIDVHFSVYGTDDSNALKTKVRYLP